MDMKGKVSIWLGKFETEEELYNYTTEKYTFDGEVSCQFYSDFDLKYIDNQFIEVAFNDPLTLEFIESASYSESFIAFFEGVDLSKWNSIILCYDFEYKGGATKKDNIEFFKVLNYVED
jgi:hypothetical protein